MANHASRKQVSQIMMPKPSGISWTLHIYEIPRFPEKTTSRDTGRIPSHGTWQNLKFVWFFKKSNKFQGQNRALACARVRFLKLSVDFLGQRIIHMNFAEQSDCRNHYQLNKGNEPWDEKQEQNSIMSTPRDWKTIWYSGIGKIILQGWTMWHYVRSA